MEIDSSETDEGQQSLNVIIGECINMSVVSHSGLYRPKSWECHFIYFLSAPCIQKQSCTWQLAVLVPAGGIVGRQGRNKVAAADRWTGLPRCRGRNIKLVVTAIQYLGFSTPRVYLLSDREERLVQCLVSLDKTEKEGKFEKVLINRCWSDFLKGVGNWKWFRVIIVNKCS